jgi:L-rhamnose 1-dehydrogenase
MTSTMRTVLITGASRGIGRACAVAFARAGDRVAINHPGEEAAASETARLVAEAGGAPFVVRADIGVREDVETMIAGVRSELGAIDVVVLNAGICPYRPFLEINESEWDRVFDVNVKGAFFVTQSVAPMMVAAKRGRIIAVSSISAVTGGELQAHYCASKAALSSLIRTLAIILGPHGITCNSVLPGPIETDINRDDLARPGQREYFERRIPVGRIGQPEDIAKVVCLLASEDAAYVNGAELVADGGLLVHLQ